MDGCDFDQLPYPVALTATRAIRETHTVVRACVESGIRSLDESDRDVMVLARVEGLDEREIAEMLGSTATR